MIAGAAFFEFETVARDAFEFVAGMRETSSDALRFFTELTGFVIKGEDAFFLRLLFGTEGFEMFAELGDLLFEIGDGCLGGQHLFVLGLFEGGDFAEFAFQGQRASTGFFATGNGAAVIAAAFGGEEPAMRELGGEAAGQATIGGDVAIGDARQKVLGQFGESVGEAENGGEFGERLIPTLRLRCFGGAIEDVFGMFGEEGGAAVEFAADEIDTLFGILPIADDDEFEFVVQKFFGGFFELRIDFEEIGQDANGFEFAGCASFGSGEHFFDGFCGVAAVLDDFAEGIFASFDAGVFAAEAVGGLAAFVELIALALQFEFDFAALGADGLELLLGDLETFGEFGADLEETFLFAAGMALFFLGTVAIANGGG